MEERLKLSKVSKAPPVDATHYQSINDDLRYLVHTRLDIAFAMGYVSRYMEDPQEDHYSVVKHLIHYVAGICDYGVVYKMEGGAVLVLMGYSDSDMAGNLDGYKSTTDVPFLLDHGPISWQSQKQRVVKLSTCEMEYIAMATTVCQRVWLARLLRDLTDKELRASALMKDNTSAISLSLPQQEQAH
ncbi:secreted RxLR effector protein 161-like [Phragmites australis]|uniref:secreted RxLR effector protein 161-like n=1 Tax=Phragmites australis TaxID=29695 RepID=UPI002D78AEE4|nr:secreted RxLR effector protein 161-like [Phragmites australis]